MAESLERALAGRNGARRGAMFGYPAFYAGGKLFACVFEDFVALKLPQDVVAALVTKPGFTPFRRMGRTMREWVTASSERVAGFERDPSLVLRAMKFVGARPHAK